MDDNVIQSIYSQRFHNATGVGHLGTPTTGVLARVYYAASYYDNVDRLIASADAGTNGGTAWTRPGSVPSSSPTLLVSNYQYQYTNTGLVADSIDPMGIKTRTYYDDLGRVTKSVQNYTGSPETTNSDVATEYGYDGNDNVTYVQADEPGGSYQKTAYIYAATTAAGDGVNSNDILTAIQHPDPSTGNPSSTQQDSFLTNALGDVVQSTDRNGSVHQYSYDVLGRITSDNVSTLGTGVDGTVRQITYAYDSQGNNNLITSLNGSGSIVNQVQRVYNGLGQLTGEYQSHNGAVVQGTTPEVQYAYTEMSGGQNNSRLTSMTYPSGYVLNYNYNTGLDSNISRLSSISDSANTLESYKYLGLNTVVERDHPQNNVNQTYISQNGQTGDGGDQYVGLDRFGRVVDQNWYSITTHSSVGDFQYTYNQDSEVVSRNNTLNAAMNEMYSYDNLGQLTSFARGTHTQTWTPDALGNFSSITTDGSTQTRTANQQNEYTSISGSGTISYDANGNITADGSGNTFVYDAWNRLVAVKNGTTTLAAYSYDGMNHRITETHGSTTTDLYYSANWQVLEEWNNGQLQARYVWSPAGVDTLVLRDDSSQNNGVLDRRLYVQQDMLGNVTALPDTSGNVVERYDYDPFGAATVLNPDFSVRGTSSYNWNYLFQGKRYDGTVGLYDSRGRVYSPTLMRWLQTDPLGLWPDNNGYRMDSNDPTNLVDPSGLWPYKWPWEKDASWSFQGSLIYDAIDKSLEPVRYVGDLTRAGQAGINNALGGTPYVPEWRSGLARNAPPPADKEANLDYLIEAEAENLMDGFIALGTFGVLRGGSKLLKQLRAIGSPILSGSAWVQAYRKTIGEIVDVVGPGALQKEGSQVCVPTALRQVLGGKKGAASVLRAMEAVAERQRGYSLEEAAKNLRTSKLAPTAKWVEKITIDELRAEASKGTVILNVPGSSAARAHAVGVTYDAATKLFSVHDPLLGVVYRQTAGALRARIIGDAIIGVK